MHATTESSVSLGSVVWATVRRSCTRSCVNSTRRTGFDEQSSTSPSVSSSPTHLSQLRRRLPSHPLVQCSRSLSGSCPCTSGTSSAASMTSRLGSPVCSAPFSRWTPQKRSALLVLHCHSHSCACTLMSLINHVLTCVVHNSNVISINCDHRKCYSDKKLTIITASN